MSGSFPDGDDMADHPDASEMRERYARVLQGHDVALMNGPVFLVGLFFALSPWALHFDASHRDLAVQDLILGAAVSVLALGFTVAPERMTGLCGALSLIGVWMAVSPWAVTGRPVRAAAADGVVVGGLALLLGVLCAVMVRRVNRGL